MSSLSSALQASAWDQTKPITSSRGTASLQKRPCLPSNSKALLQGSFLDMAAAASPAVNPLQQARMLFSVHCNCSWALPIQAFSCCPAADQKAHAHDLMPPIACSEISAILLEVSDDLWPQHVQCSSASLILTSPAACMWRASMLARRSPGLLSLDSSNMSQRMRFW